MEHEFSLTDEQAIPAEHLIQTCKYRQGKSCCRYIVYFEKPGQFFCVKKDEQAKMKIDSVIDEMHAKGDNCEGLPHETRERPEGTQGETA